MKCRILNQRDFTSFFKRNIFYNPFYSHAICQYNHTPFWKCFIVSCNAAVSSNKNTLNLGSFSESSTFRILCPLLHNQFVIDKDLTMYICVLLFCIIINTSPIFFKWWMKNFFTHHYLFLHLKLIHTTTFSSILSKIVSLNFLLTSSIDTPLSTEHSTR